MLLDALAERVVGTPGSEVPGAVRDAARRATIDTIAVAVAGHAEPVAELARRWALEVAPAPQVGLWADGRRVAAAEAAFVHGAQSHALDFDDALPSMRGHASAVLAPAGLAVAELEGATLGAYLDAFALGVEVLHHLGRAMGNLHYDRGWHATSTLGVFGAAAVAGRLWGLDAERLRVAWGLAASQAAGMTRNFGSDTKPMHAGFAARAGVLAAWMAREGASADRDVLAGPRGFLELYAAEHPDHAVEAGPPAADAWALLRPGMNVKRWPCCYASHRAIGGLIELLGEGAIDADDVNEVAVGFLPGSDRALVHQRPTTGLEAKFSIEYPLAALLLDGALSVASFDDDAVRRPAARRLMERVRRVAIPGDRLYSGSGEVGFTDVVLRAAGQERRVRIDRVPGSAAWPLGDGDFLDKVVGCLAPTYGEAAARAWGRAAFDGPESAPGSLLTDGLARREAGAP